MLPHYLKKEIKNNDLFFASRSGRYSVPPYSPDNHYKDLATSPYYHALVVLRHCIKMVTDHYFGVAQGAKNVDLFMFTPCVSSPMGPGSDSEPIPFKFGELDTFLVDSSQFGFEPLLLNGLDKVYCYLPSMRGEDSDHRHLNQFFHCEMEMKGELDMLIPIIESYVKVLAEALLRMENLFRKISQAHEKTFQNLENVLKAEKFPEISFDEAVKVLEKNNKKQYVNYTEYGNDISSDGEIELMKTLQVKTPIWVKYYHRDRVPFYQKPDASGHKVLNADLLFPSIIDGSFGGEIVGCGQRQNNAEELYESIKRQKLDAAPYEWYIDLRRVSYYSVTSGFGMGIERFISWAILRHNIRDAVLYPRLKNVLTYP